MQAQSILFVTILGCIGSYYVVNKLLDDVDTSGNAASIAGMRILATTAWSMWLLIALYISLHQFTRVWYLHLTLLIQLVIILFHGILKALEE